MCDNDEAKMKEEGYQFIGIKDYSSFQLKFKEMGEMVPLYCLSTKSKRQKDRAIGSKTSLKYRLDNIKHAK